MLQPDDDEIAWIHHLEQQALPIPPVAIAMRELSNKVRSRLIPFAVDW